MKNIFKLITVATILLFIHGCESKSNQDNSVQESTSTQIQQIAKEWSFFDIKMGMSREEVKKILKEPSTTFSCQEDNSMPYLRGATILWCSAHIIGELDSDPYGIPHLFSYSVSYTKDNKLVVMDLEFNLAHPNGAEFKQALIKKYATNLPSNIKVEILERINGPVRDHMIMRVYETNILNQLTSLEDAKAKKAINDLR